MNDQTATDPDTLPPLSDDTQPLAEPEGGWRAIEQRGDPGDPNSAMSAWPKADSNAALNQAARAWHLAKPERDAARDALLSRQVQMPPPGTALDLAADRWRRRDPFEAHDGTPLASDLLDVCRPPATLAECRELQRCLEELTLRGALEASGWSVAGAARALGLLVPGELDAALAGHPGLANEVRTAETSRGDRERSGWPTGGGPLVIGECDGHGMRRYGGLRNRPDAPCPGCPACKPPRIPSPEEQEALRIPRPDERTGGVEQSEVDAHARGEHAVADLGARERREAATEAGAVQPRDLMAEAKALGLLDPIEPPLPIAGVVQVDRVAELRAELDRLNAKFRSFDGGDRAPSPPVSLIRDIWRVEAELRVARAAK